MIVRKKPISRRKKKRLGDDPEYRAWIRTQQCLACYANQLTQTCPTECAHVGQRGLGQKCSDRETIPLCSVVHHRLGKTSHHVLGKNFFKYHFGQQGEAQTWINYYNNRYEAMKGLELAV